ncbi:MAG: stage V sporulation protein AB [Lachnospiraceae bacterium]
MQNILVGFSGICAGAITAAGIFALITTLEIINRFAVATRTASFLLKYENVIIVGVTAGNILSLYNIHLPGASWGIGIFGIFSGMYIGCFAVALAEVLQVIPVFARRSRLKFGLEIIILGLALGKSIGGIIYFFGGF